jgi:hypothetical protein
MSSEKSFNLKARILLFAVVILIISHYFSYSYQEGKINGIRGDLNRHLTDAYKIERKFIEHIPIYRDFTSPAKEQKLRKHLLMDHIDAAKKYGIKPVTDDNGIEENEKNGKLVNIGKEKNSLYYFHNVRKKYRFLTENASKGLKLLTERYQVNLKKRADLPVVKIALSSVIRPVSYQKKLMRRNSNASFISTHSFGTSFDIFYDDYFVSVPLRAVSNDISEDMVNRLRTRIGYMMGDSLRRQLRSVLMETLIELQDEGKLYAILEKRQRCYHVTILN